MVYDSNYSPRDSRAHAPLFYLNKQAPSVGDLYLENERDVFRPMNNNLNLAENYDQEMLRAQTLSLASEPTNTQGCSFRDRFDRDGVVAYNFSDGQSRLALHMTLDDVGFSGAEVERAMVRYTYKFQAIPHRKERCRYKSKWQGLVGSGYNELFQRKTNTVWQELRDTNPLGMFD
jgi:hypothetical protein